MSSDLAVSVRGLGKVYQINRTREKATTLAEALARRLRRPFARGERDASFEALKDVSFDLCQGEVLGVVGRNGAGKSTLLKILAQIMAPSSGEVDIYGRVGSLLEVGTGFHPELTGRENVYLNGAILGMSRAEISREFDSIIAFAETEAFLDVPVKRYSSGMQVRLAFAVAAHLRTEILLVDEVLAVGDVAFQRRCMGRMREVANQEGRTVFFVSHNLGAVSSLTQRSIYLDQGQLADFGPTSEVVNRYLASNCAATGEWMAATRTERPLQILRVRLLDDDGVPRCEFEASSGFQVELEYEVREAARNALVEFFIYTADGVHLLTSGDHDTAPEQYQQRTPGRYTARVKVPGNLLNLGSYLLRINSGTHHETFDHEDVLSFQMFEPRQLTTRHNRRGCLVPMLPWLTTPSN